MIFSLQISFCWMQSLGTSMNHSAKQQTVITINEALKELLLLTLIFIGAKNKNK